MARGYRRGGSRSGGRSRSSGTQRGGSRRQTQEGQVKDGKVVQYAVKDKNGKTTYIGSTNNPARRAAQHKASDKMRRGDTLEVQSRPITRGKAERLESGRLKGHRQQHGRNPQHNATNDGQYHPRR